MDDSPRSSKRRKLATTGRRVSSPPVKSALRKTSRRLPSRPSPRLPSETPETDDEGALSTRVAKTSPANGKLNGTSKKRALSEERDIYDDIEGALGSDNSSPERSPAPKTQGIMRGTSRPSGAKRGSGNTSTPSKAAKHKSKPLTGLSKSAGRTKRRDTEAIEASQSLDQGVLGTGTPSKSRSRTQPATSTRRAGRAIPTEQRADSSVHTPSRSSRRRKEVSESEDGPQDYYTPSRTPTTADRRRANRTDNFNNEDDIATPIVVHNGNTGKAIHQADGEGISVTGSVLDPTEPSPFNKPSPATRSAPKTKVTSPLLLANFTPGRQLDLLTKILLERITGKRWVPLVDLDEEYKSVHQLVERTITAGEGNSMLLIGGRGSGKTALVNKVLSKIERDNSGEYHVVRLNGFIHTDDKIALREIWRQLGKEMDIDEDGGLGKNYADTLTTLLALLSHPSEQTGEVTDQVAKAVVFVMDEFDLFASHPRQTLLYNLFDIAQSRKAPIAVLGLTTRIDIANSLEKRVKSRFSHRYVHLSLAKTFSSFQEMCKATLIVQSSHLSVEEQAILTAAPSTTPAKKARNRSAKQDVLTEWNSNISSLFASKPFLVNQLAPHFYRTKSIPTVLTSFLLPTASISNESPSLDPTTVLSPPDSKLALIPELSTVALALLIAAARLDIIHDSDTCNFNMAYDEYVTLASKARIQSAAGGASASGVVSKVWGKEVAKREWESLVELSLIMPVVSGMTGDFGMVRCDVALEEIGAVLQGEKGIEKALERWCRQL